MHGKHWIHSFFSKTKRQKIFKTPSILQNLPPAICKEVEKCESEEAILESCIGKWKMGLSRNCENDLICFRQGWPEFVDRHALSIGDFLVFEPTNRVKHLHLHVYVFDSSACEKELSIEKKATRAINPTAGT